MVTREGGRVKNCQFGGDVLFEWPLRKLYDVGIRGKVFNIIRNIYTDDKAYLKMDGKITEAFTINQGVRQGCVLSPLLFNIFMAGLAKSLTSLDEGLIMGNSKINCIFWADDIVLLCENGSQLDKMIKIISKYCEENKLTINCKKTKCLIFIKDWTPCSGAIFSEWKST